MRADSLDLAGIYVDIVSLRTEELAASINPRRVQRAHKAQGKSHGAQGLSLD